jgi:hypothetical protein
VGCCSKAFGTFAEGMIRRVKELAYQAARKAGRPIGYLRGGSESKEELARELAQRDKINSGLIALFTALEPCLSYTIRGERSSKKLKLVLETRKCLHLYHYYMHPSFGLMHVRLQSWFPFTVDICLNGREWLTRQLDQCSIAKRVNETTGQVAANFRGQVTTSFKERPEGVRLRHALNGNSLKIYDKEGIILRVETTIVRPEEFKVYRPVRDQADGQLKWQRLRRAVVDLYRRAEISRAANSRYLEALASVTGTTPLFEEAQNVCQALIVRGRRYQALNPWSAQDGALLEAINRGEFAINGLRNRDLVRLLYSSRASAKERPKCSAAITR